MDQCLKKKIDTRAIGLDISLSLARWLTGNEHLHYGLWTGLEPCAANLGAAQEAYTTHLLGHLPEGKLRILDIGGGAGETAARLGRLGHKVDIIVPSARLAARCRDNAPDASVHEMRFEDFGGDGPFDLCLFSESFQYIPLAHGLPRCVEMLAPGGHIIVADCFRAGDQQFEARAVGGGHSITRFWEQVEDLPLDVVIREDLTDQVAHSIDIESGFLAIFGDALVRIDEELAMKKPWMRRVLATLWRLLISQRRRESIQRRIKAEGRTSEAFRKYNRYLLVKLQKT